MNALLAVISTVLTMCTYVLMRAGTWKGAALTVLILIIAYIIADDFDRHF